MHAKIVLLYENEAGKALCDTASRIIAEAAVSFGHTFTLPVRRCPAQDTVPDDVLELCAQSQGIIAASADMRCLPDLAAELLCTCRVRELRYAHLIQNRSLTGENRPLNTLLIQALSADADALRDTARRAYAISAEENLPILQTPPAGKLAQDWKAAVGAADSLRAPFHAREIALADVIPMMINQPERLGVLLCPPYAGAILSPAAGALCGAPGINYDIYLGGECPLCAPLEQNDNALRDQLNPFGLLRAIEHLLREGMHLEREAACIEASMRNVLQAGWRTGDIALPDTPPLQMNGVTELICEQIEVAGEWITHE